MQEKDTESVNEQHRRRNRISRMKNMIVLVLGGWVVLSMILIITLFVIVFHMHREMSQMFSDNKMTEKQNGQYIDSETEMFTDATENSEVLLQSEVDNYKPVVPIASGISEEENAARVNDKHKVYLTFEDGPSKYTEDILDVLKEKNIKATFFVTGQEGDTATDLYKRMVEEGHTLGMHTYSNKYSTIYQSEEHFKEDVEKLRTYLFEVTGMESVYYRFPGGSSNQITNVPMEKLIHYLNQEGLIYYDWNIASGDLATNAYTVDEIVANITGDVVKYKTSVVQLHDGADATITAEVVEKLIDALLEMNVEILPIDKDTSVIQSVKANAIE